MRLKQEILHPTAAILRPAALWAGLCFLGAATAGASAQAPGAAVVSKETGTLRLVAEAGLRDGRYRAGVEIVMPAGGHTYWQIPGEAGVPPVFTFNGSENVGAAVVKYPVPLRITEEGLDAFGYRDRVTFPVEVTPADPARPAVLHVDVSYAVCSKLCLPAHGEASLSLRQGGAGVAPELVRQAFESVPRPVADAPALSIVAKPGAAEPTWVLDWDGPTPPRDIFPVAPEGAVFATKRTAPKAWTLTALSAATSANALDVPVTLVLAGDPPTQVTRTFTLKPPAVP